MNRYRLNQLLEILLFPIIDSQLADVDPMLDCVRAYYDFMEESRRSLSTKKVRNMKDKQYKQAINSLTSYLIKRNHGNVKSKDDIQMLCEFFYPIADMERALEGIVKGRAGRMPDEEAISVYYILSMGRISRSLITYRDGIASIKQWVNEPQERFASDIFSSPTVFNKIEVWNLLCRKAMPDFFIAIAAAEEDRGVMALYEQSSNIALADKLLSKSISKGMAENHLHFNVGFTYDVVWLSHMDLNFVEEESGIQWNRENIIRMELAVFRYLAAVYLMMGGDKNFGKWAEEQVPLKLLDVMGMLYTNAHDKVEPDRLKPDWQLREALHKMRSYRQNRTIGREYDYLLREVYNEFVEYRTSSEFILLYQSYCYIRDNMQDTFYARLFIQYLRLKNEYFSRSIQTHLMQGLKNFQEYYDFSKLLANKALPVKNEIMTEIFRSQAKILHLRKLEIRIAPEVDGTIMDVPYYHRNRRSLIRQLYDQLGQVLRAYRRFILESVLGIGDANRFLHEEGKNIRQELPLDILQAAKDTQANVPTLGIVYHFIKTEHLENRSGSYCWRNISNGSEHYSSYRLLRRLYGVNVAMALEEVREILPGISEYIVGIDAASDENAMEPWMFAPAYKAMRSHENTRPVITAGQGAESFERVQNIGFTYHVGEDIRHIASGLRHVDEVLEGFGYKAGDRLGHAIVLGLDIAQWMRDNEAVPIPRLEHLENLLWMWGTNSCFGLELPIKLEVLETQIMNLAREIYGSTENLSVRMLYSAYKKKFDSDHEQIMQRVVEEEREGCGGCLHERKGGLCCQKTCRNFCYGTWTVERLLLTHYCPVFEEKYSKIEIIPVSGDDSSVYKMLQDYLISKVERRGIYIETNPTSNLTIGDFSHMHQHPIFALNGRNGEGHRAFVTVNSDDPAVFNTNVENELAYIYYAAEAQGVAKSDIIEWVETIRQYGMDASFIQREKSPEQILMELQQIIWKMEKAEF